MTTRRIVYIDHPGISRVLPTHELTARRRRKQPLSVTAQPLPPVRNESAFPLPHAGSIINRQP